MLGSVIKRPPVWLLMTDSNTDTDIVFGYSGDGCPDYAPGGDKQFIAMQIEGLNKELKRK